MTLLMKFFVPIQVELHCLTMEKLCCENGTNHIP